MTNTLKEKAKNWNSLERVGRDGKLFLEFSKVGHRTITNRIFFKNPLQVFPSIELEGEKCAYTQILNPCGGMVGGDRFDITLCLKEGAHALISTPSANRIYRSQGETSIQTIHVEIGSGGVLEWIPEITIPFEGSKYMQKMNVLHIGKNGKLFLWDAYCSGRVGRDERWKFTRFSNQIQVTNEKGQEIFEHFDLEPKILNGFGATLRGNWDYFASFYIIGLEKSLKKMGELEKQLGDCLEFFGGQLFGGVSRLTFPGLIIRLVSRSSIDLLKAFHSLWCIARREILGRPVPGLRKY